jgi:hypothetical protein
MKNKSIKKFYCENNEIGNDGINVIIESLSKNSTLLKLTI